MIYAVNVILLSLGVCFLDVVSAGLGNVEGRSVVV
jgi:hypothetical protein